MFILTPDQLPEFATLTQATGERAVIHVTPERIEAYMGEGKQVEKPE